MTKNRLCNVRLRLSNENVIEPGTWGRPEPVKPASLGERIRYGSSSESSAVRVIYRTNRASAAMDRKVRLIAKRHVSTIRVVTTNRSKWALTRC